MRLNCRPVSSALPPSTSASMHLLLVQLPCNRLELTLLSQQWFALSVGAEWRQASSDDTLCGDARQPLQTPVLLLQLLQMLRLVRTQATVLRPALVACVLRRLGPLVGPDDGRPLAISASGWSAPAYAARDPSDLPLSAGPDPLHPGPERGLVPGARPLRAVRCSGTAVGKQGLGGEPANHIPRVRFCGHYRPSREE